MDLCLSCKGCRSECPSAVDVAKMKAEFLQHYYDANGVPLRSRMVGDFSRLMKIAHLFPNFYNFLYKNNTIRTFLNRISGFHPERTMPLLHTSTLQEWYRRYYQNHPVEVPGKGRVYLFCDEFTNYHDVPVGMAAIALLHGLGYEVVIPSHVESGRTWLSKGLVRRAQKIARQNFALLHPIISTETPLIGLEPSAILSFRDEYPDLVPPNNVPLPGRWETMPCCWKSGSCGKSKRERFKKHNSRRLPNIFCCTATAIKRHWQQQKH